MGHRIEGVHRAWGALEFRSATEEVGEGSAWSLRSERHTLKILRFGQVQDYAVRLDGGPRERRALGPGSLCLVPAGRAYEACGRGARIAFSVVSFPGLGDVRPVFGARDEFVFQVAARLDEALTRGEERLGETLAGALLLHLQSRYVESPSPDAGLDAPQRRRLDTYLDANLHARPTVGELARTLGMGRSRFVAAFQRSYGTTPARHVRELRLERARRRLEIGPCEITELALDLGFASHSHLSAAFKARYGVPPRDYRRRGDRSAP